MGRAQGIDVSHYHRVRDWDGIVRSGISIFGAKATNGRATDEAFVAHRDVARIHPFELCVWYHFPKPGSSAVAQAQNLVRAVGDKIGPNERLALDVELDPESKWCPDVRFVDQFVQELVHQLGDRRQLVYSSARVWRELVGSPSWPSAIVSDCWLAHYGVEEPALPVDQSGLPIWPKWTLWQDSETFGCPHVDGGIADHDVFNGTLEELRAYAKLAGT